MARDTTTGSDYEAIIATCIERSCRKNGLTSLSQSMVGEKPGGGKHRIDWEIFSTVDPSNRGLISCKFQQTSGTAEEKIAYEVIKLLHTMKIDSRYKHGWIVMGGKGWSAGILNFVKKELPFYLPLMQGKVTIVSTDEFIQSGVAL